MIRILRPTNRRDAFDADENAPRKEVFSINKFMLPRKIKTGEEGAEQMFHILNAPEEMLSDWEAAIAKEFRALDNYSLSTGDVVEVDSKKYLCESFGWKAIA